MNEALMIIYDELYDKSSLVSAVSRCKQLDKLTHESLVSVCIWQGWWTQMEMRKKFGGLKKCRLTGVRLF
jgi:hypothetical protein